jgi:UDP-2,3-diacylglucosamine pyrophosphatase LpxH
MLVEGETHRRYRAIWISDVHLGTRGCQAEHLLEFLRTTDSTYLYLVGDIVDGWRLKRHWYWPQSHNDVVQKVLRKARKGTQVIYIPGNHDEGFRQFLGHEFGRVRIVDDTVHTTADGRRFLVIHGDQFDIVCNYAPWLALLGDYAYRTAMWCNIKLNWMRRATGKGHWSLSAYLKHKVKNAVEFIGRYEHALAGEARRRGVDGVICGHIHHAEMRDMDGITYVNDGDWVESCTALVEYENGTLEIIRWLDVQTALTLRRAA